MGGPFFLAWSFAPLTILVVIAAFAIRAIWVTITPPRKGVKQPSCEKCKYPVAGLTTLKCPECGSDLRCTGIITRSMEMRRRGGLASALVGVTFLIVAVFGIATSVLYSVLERRATRFVPSPWITTTTFTPRSGAYLSLVLEQPSESVRSNASLPLYDAALVLQMPDGGSSRFEVAHSLRFTSIDVTSKREHNGRLGREALTAWFERANVDTKPAAVQAEIDQALDMLRATLNYPHQKPTFAASTAFSIGSITTKSPSSPASAPQDPFTIRKWMAWATPAIACVVWAVLCILIVLRRRKLLREADAPTPSPAPAITA